MKKYIKNHIKNEKRILKLMYKKGIFEELRIDLKNIGWEFLKPGKRKRRRGDQKYSFTEYLPELHVFSCDYWGEWDSRSVIEFYQEHLFYGNAEYCEIEGWSIDNSIPRTRQDILKHLQTLPTVNNDSQFNKFLKIDYTEQ